MKKRKVIVLASGGIDSSILIHFMARKGYEAHPVFVRQGLVWEGSEIFWLRKFLSATGGRRIKSLKVLEVPVSDIYQNHWSVTGKNIPDYQSRDESVYLPGRNILLLAKAAVYGVGCGIREFALGPLSGNPFPDARRKFFDAFEKALGLALNSKIKIHTPFLDLTKRQVLTLGKGLPLELTFSCLAPSRNHQSCGACNKCRERECCYRVNLKNMGPRYCAS